MKPQYAATLAAWAVIVVFPLAAPNASALEVTITIEEHAFMPQVMLIHVGNHVTWSNRDDGEHFLTSSGPASRATAVDVGDLEFHQLLTPGSYYSHVFKAPGVYTYFCAIHLGMWGTIIVEP